RTLIKRDFEDCFNAGINAILTPTTPSAAFAIGEKSADPIEMYLNDVFTVTVNMAGLPGISVPAGLDQQGLPLGLQLIGRPFDEETLFSLGAVIEAAAGRVAPEEWWGGGDGGARKASWRTPTRPHSFSGRLTDMAARFHVLVQHADNLNQTRCDRAVEEDMDRLLHLGLQVVRPCMSHMKATDTAQKIISATRRATFRIIR